MVVVHPCRFASLLVFAPASSCGGGRLSCVDRWVVRIKPHHLDGGGQVSWVDIGPHPSTEGRGQDGGGQGGGWWHPRRPTSFDVAERREGGGGGSVLYTQRHLTWQSGGVLRGCGGVLEESGTLDFTEIVKVQHSRDSVGRTLFVEKPRHDVWIFTHLDPFSRSSRPRLPKSPR